MTTSDLESKTLLITPEYCFTSTETVGLLGTGAQDDHLDFHTAPELSVFICFCFIMKPFGLFIQYSPE